LKDVFGQEFVTCQTNFKILLEKQLTPWLKFLNVPVKKPC